ISSREAISIGSKVSRRGVRSAPFSNSPGILFPCASPARLDFSLCRVPVFFQIRDQCRAEMAIGLLAAIDRHVAAENVERFFADAEDAPITGGADHAR